MFDRRTCHKYASEQAVYRYYKTIAIAIARPNGPAELCFRDVTSTIFLNLYKNFHESLNLLVFLIRYPMNMPGLAGLPLKIYKPGLLKDYPFSVDQAQGFPLEILLPYPNQ